MAAGSKTSPRSGKATTRSGARRAGADARAGLAERVARGAAERESVPLEAHAEWSPPAVREDPVAVLEAQNATRVPELVPIRHGRMIVSPFTFYRGGAGIMAADLAATPTTTLRAQCCGDAHLSNFGTFAAPDRRLVFDLNDFDETLPAPFEWDLKRLAASLVVAARGNGHRPKEQRQAARMAAMAYRHAIGEAARMRFLDLWYARVEAEAVLDKLSASLTKARRKSMERNMAKTRSRTNLGSLAKFAERGEDGFRIRQQPPLIVGAPDERREEIGQLVNDGLSDYAQTLSPDRRLVLGRYRLEDYARKVVGVGSVGTEALMVLLMGDFEDDPLFLQVKEAQRSVLEPYAGAGEYEQQGERVVQGQRLMQAASDSLLGWITGRGEQRRHFYVRQLRDMKGSADVETLDPNELAYYGALCAVTLARAQARTGDAAAIAAYLGEDDTFERAIARFAVSYADQSDADYAAFTAAAESGRIAVERDV